MSVYEGASASSRGRRISTWSDQFCTGQHSHAGAGNINPLPVSPGETEVDAFIRAGEDILAPPCLNYKSLESFLQRARLAELTDLKPCPRLSKLCLIDDRSSSSIQNRSDPYCFRKNLDERELYHRLLQKRSDTHADRRVLLIESLTPLCAIALATTAANNNSAAELKGLLQSHLLGEIMFWATINQPVGDSVQNRLDTELSFSIGFHLSYVALREGCVLSDPRGVRQSYSMIRPLGDSNDVDELFYYDAQISFLITGTNESQWTAYCIVDTYMGSEQNTEAYFQQHLDGPSGGAIDESQPCWNPREYFLLVLSQRIRQTTREWANVISALMERLDAYESHYIRIIDIGSLRDNTDMSQSRSYMKAVSILRQLHDTLSAHLDSLGAFLDGTRYFETQTPKPEPNEQWRCYFDRISREMVHLQRWRRRLLQRAQRFDDMKDGILGASALFESRRSTKQGDDIGTLTNMTVAYLPFNLAASIFSISTSTPKGLVWAYWVITSVILGFVTFYFAFWKRSRNYWRRWQQRGDRGGGYREGKGNL